MLLLRQSHLKYNTYLCARFPCTSIEWSQL